MSAAPAAAPDREAALSESGGILEDVNTRVSSPVLIGRSDQLSALDDALARVQRGGTSAVLIGGEAASANRG